MAGQHLDAFIGDANKAIEKLPGIVRAAKLMPVIPEQKAYNEQHAEEPVTSALVYPDTPAAFFALCKVNQAKTANEIVGFYPFLREGAPNTLEILELKPDEDNTEGAIETVNRNAVTITFFDPTFACHRAIYKNGAKFEFSIAALAYLLEKVEDTTINIDEGPALEIERRRRKQDDPNADTSKITSVELSMAELRCLLPRDNGVDSEFQTVVEGVEYFHVDGTEICKMPVILMRPDDEDFRAILYASEHVLKGYRPKIGDSIRGLLWLQGYPLRQVNDPTNWGDRLTPASPQYGMEDVARFFAAQDFLDDQHPGVIAVGSTCVRTGWTIGRYDNPHNSPDFPTLRLTREGRKVVNVWIRAYIVDQEPAQRFIPAEIAAYRATCAERDEGAAFVTVACTDIGKGYMFKMEGLDTLEQHIGKVGVTEYIAKPEFRKPIQISSNPSTPLT